jgi:hypothetical protein
VAPPRKIWGDKARTKGKKKGGEGGETGGTPIPIRSDSVFALFLPHKLFITETKETFDIDVGSYQLSLI